MSSSSFRSHRIIIASLFLPQTVVVSGDGSGKSTPNKRKGAVKPQSSVDEVSIVDVMLKLQNDPTVRATGSGLPISKPVPLKSIVEDLRDRVR